MKFLAALAIVLAGCAPVIPRPDAVDCDGCYKVCHLDPGDGDPVQSLKPPICYVEEDGYQPVLVPVLP
ncbi:hypothetical protein ACIBG8_15995 [Nonomuraea sp. NPDC050556]|uniref:hypothetical protein n=1 Tax=Nonomuraea sp. NPDC050556 TaxID=3364369 RepID=UPI00378862F7